MILDWCRPQIYAMKGIPPSSNPQSCILWLDFLVYRISSPKVGRIYKRFIPFDSASQALQNLVKYPILFNFLCSFKWDVTQKNRSQNGWERSEIWLAWVFRKLTIALSLKISYLCEKWFFLSKNLATEVSQYGLSNRRG